MAMAKKVGVFSTLPCSILSSWERQDILALIMETLIVLLLLGFCFGFYIRGRRIASLNEQNLQLQGKNLSLNRRVLTLEREKDAFCKQDAKRKQKDERRRQHHQENDVKDTRNQLRFIGQCGLRPERPVNCEAARVLYAIDEWIKICAPPGWRFAFEVSMGSFIKTCNDSEKSLQDSAFRSYNSKRVDFLLIDNRGFPRLVVEYNGSGHAPLGKEENAEERMKVKRLALKRAGIPLLEINQGTPKRDVLVAISEAVG